MDTIHAIASVVSLISFGVALWTISVTKEMQKETEVYRKQALEARKEAENMKQKMLEKKRKSDLIEKLKVVEQECVIAHRTIDDLMNTKQIKSEHIVSLSKFQKLMKKNEKSLHVSFTTVQSFDRALKSIVNESNYSTFISDAFDLREAVNVVNTKYHEKREEITKELEELD
ncbi:hypothetical protein [Evansella cellulosilytica]|uniref:Uncharacterized protein n=1 Tax=Evansella cellulosilytica (strain ATCC 21833 / DSM 2522 / FERM P-1141 / JCM 9156 / N-4) TaxID=649639 RepID=E6TUQ3_EVAC2|nr:hypothetical protein [Evansella cellulosilytica]ADU32055.1 hypothetical protein Bcell_3816 [Evansella cellulosilytica DSM 2522]